jgi:hypothetical protein
MKLLLVATAVASGLAGPCILDNNSTQLEKYLSAAAEQHTRSPLGQPTPKGPYVAKYDRIAKVPGLTMGGPTSAVIIYPDVAGDENDDATFPLLSFAHATYIGGLFPKTDVSYKTLMDKVVSYGFVVVAPETCPDKECFSTFAKDQIATIDACKADPSLHPALKAATFDKVGVFGHSMGAMATVASAGGSSLHINPADHGIVAAVSMHTCQDLFETGTSVSVPIMFTTGSSDKVCADGCAQKYYNQVPTSDNKVLLSVLGASHFDPTNTGSNREDEAIALFLTCHVRGEHCDEVYGPTGKAICSQVEGGSAAQCHVVGTAPAQ